MGTPSGQYHLPTADVLVAAEHFLVVASFRFRIHQLGRVVVALVMDFALL